MGLNQKQKSISEGIAELIENKLESYFDALNGDQPANNLYNQIIKEVERPLIASVLSLVNGNKVKASEILGINRNTLAKKIKELKLP